MPPRRLRWRSTSPAARRSAAPCAAARAAAGLTVECVRGGRPEESTVTDDTGQYRFDGVDDGELDVTVRDDVGATLAARA